MNPSWIWSDKITNERVARVGCNQFISNKGEWNNCFSKFSNRFCRRFLFPQFYKASGKKIFKLGALFSIWRKLRLLAHSRRFLANQNARNAIVGAENFLKKIDHSSRKIYIIRNHRRIRDLGGVFSLSSRMKILINSLTIMFDPWTLLKFVDVWFIYIFGNVRLSSEIFGNPWKMFGNVCVAFGQFLENLS